MSPTKFRILGPYTVPIQVGPGGRIVDRTRLPAFWAQSNHGPSKGCYIFAVRSSRATIPWYVGKTTRGFEHEAFAEHKLNKYSQALIHVKKGTPLMFLVVSLQKKGKTNGKAIEDLELDLINDAFQVNDKLQNDRGIDSPRYEIEGVGKIGKPSKPRQALGKMLRW